MVMVVILNGLGPKCGSAIMARSPLRLMCISINISESFTVVRIKIQTKTVENQIKAYISFVAIASNRL